MEPLIEVVGAVFILSAFVLAQLGRLATASLVYLSLNLVGSGVLAATGIAIVAVALLPMIALLGLGTAGAGISVAAPALLGRAGRLAGAASRGAVVSMLTTVGYLGFILGPPFVGLLAGATDLRVSFASLAALALLLAGFSWRALGTDRVRASAEEEGEAQ